MSSLRWRVRWRLSSSNQDLQYQTKTLGSTVAGCSQVLLQGLVSSGPESDPGFRRERRSRRLRLRCSSSKRERARRHAVLFLILAGLQVTPGTECPAIASSSSPRGGRERYKNPNPFQHREGEERTLAWPPDLRHTVKRSDPSELRVTMPHSVRDQTATQSHITWLVMLVGRCQERLLMFVVTIEVNSSISHRLPRPRRGMPPSSSHQC